MGDSMDAAPERSDAAVVRSADVAALSRAANLRAGVSSGSYAPLIEEVASVRAAARALTSADYAIGEWKTLRIETEGGARNVDILKKDANTVIVRSQSNVLRESVRSGDQIDHYANPDRTRLFANSRVLESEGSIRDWILDENGNATPIPETSDASNLTTEIDLESHPNDQAAAPDIEGFNKGSDGSFNKGSDGTWP